jgi:predicted transport protein
MSARAATGWSCPSCKRRFTRPNQRHACGTARASDVLRNRPPELVATYQELEKVVKSLGKVEVVARDRYVLFRSQKIFADVVITAGAVRLAIHLARRVADPRFIKVVADGRHATHVVKLEQPEQVHGFTPYLREAYAFSVAGARP